MATTKIWKVTDNLNRSVNYVKNPEKTEYLDMRQALHYIGKEEKTKQSNESLCYITGINCGADTAYEEMMMVKQRFGKVGGNLAYHSYQSFLPGELDADTCHEIGVKLAKRLWGDRYQVVVATHLDREHLHNHFLVNSVSFVDGKKFNDNRQAYIMLRTASDDLCRAYGLSVIEHPQGKTPRNIYFAEKNGEPTRFNLMREAMDTALKITTNRKEFKYVLYELGYELNDDPYRTYATIRRIGSKKAVRLFRLGESYDIPQIDMRLEDNLYRYGSNLYLYYRKQAIKSFHPSKKVKVKGNCTRKISGLYGLYRLYMYKLGAYQRNMYRHPLSPEMREECRKMEMYSRQNRLIVREKLETVADVKRYIENQNSILRDLDAERKKCYNRLRRCEDPEEIRGIKDKRDGITAKMYEVRKDRNTAKKIVESCEKMRENLKAEHLMQKEKYQRDMVAYRRFKNMVRGWER